MESILTATIGYDELAKWLVIAVIVGLFLLKVYPMLKERMTASDKKDQEVMTKIDALCRKVDTLQKEVGVLSEKVGRDYQRLNRLEESTQEQDRMLKSSLEEREILTFGLLSCLRGLQEQGCNGPVSEGIDKLEQYMLRQSHKGGA